MAIIISIRSSHTDAFAAQLVTEGIKYLAKTFPHIPLALCYEADPNETLDTQIQGWKEKIDNGKSRFFNQAYTSDEEEHDKAIFRLLQATRLYKANYIPTDLPDIGKIPLGHPSAQALKDKREDNMVEKLLQAADKFSGIIFDFGGINHTTSIQKKLFALQPPIASKHPLYFFCCYSEEGAKYIPTELRLMQFQEKSNESYPLGLQFLTTSLKNKTDALKNFQEKLKEFAQSLEEKPQTTVSRPIENSNAQTVDNKKIINALCLAARDGKIEILKELLDSGVDSNGSVASRWTALHYACATGHFEAAKLLVQAGANTFLKNEKGNTPIELGLSKKKLTSDQIKELEALEKIQPDSIKALPNPALIHQFSGIDLKKETSPLESNKVTETAKEFLISDRLKNG